MSNVQTIKHQFKGDLCELKIYTKKCHGNEDSEDFGPGRHIQNIRNCDLFLDDHNFLIYLDVVLYKFKNARRFDIKDVKSLEIGYNTEQHCMTLHIPCLPSLEEEHDETTENSSKEKKEGDLERPLDLWKLIRITDRCCLRIDKSNEMVKLDSNFDYGFASKFKGTIRSFECDLDIVSRMPEPNRVSPLQRTIDRHIDEMKNFSRDQYKLNFVELQIPEGHDNPMRFSINFKDFILSQEERILLHKLTRDAKQWVMPDEYDIMEIDCSLVSILLAICYDIRFTSNETNCESAWTRSILSAALTYFETFTSLKDVVISFMRSSLIYPLYRNYELSKQCVEDCIKALQTNYTWILKQLLITRDIFETNERSVFNYYYIDDYIRYIYNPTICNTSHLEMLARNLKNVLLDIFKKDLGLGLQDVETELLKELIADIHSTVPNSEDDSEETDCGDTDETTDDVGSESCDSDLSTSPDSDSETEEDSVIEQKMDKLKL